MAEETRLFSDRIGLLEASLPRLSHAQALMMQALERQAAPPAAAWPLAEAAPTAPAPRAGTQPETPAAAPASPAGTPADSLTETPLAPGEEEALWRLPRVVSVHKG